jgi:hypothetical protein
MTINPLREPLAKPQPVQYGMGDLVMFFGDIYVVAMTLNISIPPYPGYKTGLSYAIRKPTWSICQFYIVPADEMEEPAAIAC